MFHKIIHWIDENYIHNPLGWQMSVFNILIVVNIVLLAIMTYQMFERQS